MSKNRLMRFFVAIGDKKMTIQRIAITVAVLASAIGVALPVQAQYTQNQSTQARDLEISAQDSQQNPNAPYSDQQLDGLANQINETADPTIGTDAGGVYAVPDVEGFPDNLVLIDSGLDTSTPEDTFGNYAIGVSF